jgi:hypothetical protein
LGGNFKKGSASFLKKRSKKLFPFCNVPRADDGAPTGKGFWFFFQKEPLSFSNLLGFAHSLTYSALPILLPIRLRRGVTFSSFYQVKTRRGATNRETVHARSSTSSQGQANRVGAL